MEFFTGKKTSLDTTFTDTELLQITPADIVRFLCFKAYGKIEPDENDKPTQARSNTLLYYKKAISMFMPRQKINWDPVEKRGNPTRSEEVNSLINRVRKAEVRKHGAPSKKTRPVELEEFLNVLKLNKSNEKRKLQRFWLSAALTIQWQLICRVDDVMKLQFQNISGNLQHDFTLFCRLSWSKNILDERECPDQIVLGSMNPIMCPLLNLASYIESTPLITLRGKEGFVFDNPEFGHRVAREYLNKIFCDEDFLELKRGRLGTHSFRKGPATYASRCGQSKDAVNRRGRWRKNRMVDVYIDHRLPVPDATIAAVLCGPAGACKYKLRKKYSEGIFTETFLLNEIAKNCKQVMDRKAAKTLSLPLIWAAFQPEKETLLLDPKLRNRLLKVFRESQLQFEECPVERVRIQPFGKGAQLGFLEVTSGPDQNIPTNSKESYSNLLSQQFALQSRIEEVQDSILTELHRVKVELKNMSTSIKRLSRQPAFRNIKPRVSLQPETTNRSSTIEGARLSKCPKDLYTLWKEFEFGIRGNKPAKLFTRRERGAQKAVYSRRKLFWDLVLKLLKKGHTSDTAIDRIYAVYGRNLAVTNILQQLRLSKKNGYHPDLQ